MPRRPPPPTVIGAKREVASAGEAFAEACRAFTMLCCTEGAGAAQSEQGRALLTAARAARRKLQEAQEEEDRLRSARSTEHNAAPPAVLRDRPDREAP